MKIEQKLKDMGIELTAPGKPVAAYVPGVRTGNLIFVSGQIPKKDGQIIKGRVGESISIEDAYEAAKLCCISCLAVVKSMIGDLDKVKQIVKVTGFVNSVPESGDQPKVVNGASELLKEVFGEKGNHARAAIGHSGLPLNVPVEVEMIVEVE
ncbi:RidA family protein [Clostridium sp. 'deep sea']|uniref:RidA family protein n=1 Tax=Clostridium sp. 'deep sea' TaxID=2779445 RepID=UPI0018969E8B|nr:RidA family protein [Clostridium sp. 'deep sea']QOR35817.1 RidA family protein [Clostridium sp. 'deep sea']